MTGSEEESYASNKARVAELERKNSASANSTMYSDKRSQAVGS